MAESVLERKKKLRETFLKTRDNLSKAVYLQKCTRIFEHTCEWVNSLNINHAHCYLSINDRNEVKTDEIIGWLIRNHFTVSVPVVNFKKNTLEHYQISKFDNFILNKWGVREPKPEARIRRTEPVLFDIIFVPVVATDREKNRLGYGKGFYDQFLSNTTAVKAALAFDCCISDQPLPVESFDIKMDLIITDRGIIR